MDKRQKNKKKIIRGALQFLAETQKDILQLRKDILSRYDREQIVKLRSVLKKSSI